MVKLQQQVNKVLRSSPYVDAFMSSVAQGGNAGRFMIRLKPRSERSVTPEQIIESLRPKLNALPSIKTYLQNPPLIRIGGMQTRSLYQFTLQSPDLDQLYRVGADFETRMRDYPGAGGCVQRSPAQQSGSHGQDRPRYGLLSECRAGPDRKHALFAAYGSKQVSMIYTSTDNYYVILEVLPQFQRDPNALGLLYVKSRAGKLVPLSQARQPGNRRRARCR